MCYGVVLQRFIVSRAAMCDHNLWGEQPNRPEKNRGHSSPPEICGLDLLPKIKSMGSIIRDIEMHNRNGAYDHGADTRVYDTHGVTLPAIRLKADWSRRRLRLDRAYLVYGDGDNENN